MSDQRPCTVHHSATWAATWAERSSHGSNVDSNVDVTFSFFSKNQADQIKCPIFKCRQRMCWALTAWRRLPEELQRQLRHVKERVGCNSCSLSESAPQSHRVFHRATAVLTLCETRFVKHVKHVKHVKPKSSRFNRSDKCDNVWCKVWSKYITPIGHAQIKPFRQTVVK